MVSYNERLKCELERRDKALSKMKSSGDAVKADIGGIVEQTQASIGSRLETTKSNLNRTVEEWGAKLSPEGFVRKHPWGATLGALAAGIAVVPVLRSYFKASKSKTRIVHASPDQKVVVEVVGARPADGSAMKAILDALVAGLPAVALYLKKFMQEYAGDGFVPEGDGMPAAETPASVSAAQSSRPAQTDPDLGKSSGAIPTPPARSPHSAL